MTEGNYTPGPWELCKWGDYSDFDGNSRVLIGDDRRIAAIHVSDDDTNANALLIAAAPELLAALKGVLRVADRATDEFDAARAAIAKAEGK